MTPKAASAASMSATLPASLKVQRAEARVFAANATIRDAQAEVAKSVGNASTLRELAERLQDAEQELKSANAAVVRARADIPSNEEIQNSLQSFTPLWEAMTAPERARTLSLILERVAYDGTGGTLAITFRPGGFRALSPTTTESTHES